MAQLLVALVLLCVAGSAFGAPIGKSVKEATTSVRNDRKTEGFSADVSGSFSWGGYSTPGLPDDSHAGMAVPLFAGYRFANDIEVGGALTFGFPEISVPNAVKDSAFSYRAFGLQAGYLWRKRIEPFVAYFPFASLSQSTESRVATTLIENEFNYQGHAYGGGVKVFLTERDNRAVQIGFKFGYTRERYTRASFESRIKPNQSAPSPTFIPTSAPQSNGQNVSGDSYQLGLFIGL